MTTHRSLHADVASLLRMCERFSDDRLAQAAADIWRSLKPPDADGLEFRLVRDGVWTHVEVLVPSDDGRDYGAYFGLGFMSSFDYARRLARNLCSRAEAVGISAKLHTQIESTSVA